MGHRFARAVLLIALLGAQQAPAEVAGAPWFHETLAFEGAAIFAFLDTDVDYRGRDIDLERQLDLDRYSTLPSLELRWRFSANKKHHLDLGYFSILRSDSRNIEFDLELPGGGVIPAGARTETDFDVHVATLTYGYAILHDARKELGIVVGLDFIVADASVTGRFSAAGGAVEIDDDLIEEKFNVPFPTAGVYFDWAFSDRLALLSRFQYFGLKYQGVTGKLFQGGLRLQHRTLRHLDLFVGYEALGASVDFDGSIDWFSLVYHGPTLGAALRF